MLAVLFVGIYGLITMPKNLFPDVERPTVIVITKIPGATAELVTNTVSKPIEEEIARLALIRNISSTNVANFSIVKAEFEYDKGLNAAAVDVNNALSIVRSKLPSSASPAIYTTGSFTLPVDVITLSPKVDSVSLADISSDLSTNQRVDINLIVYDGRGIKVPLGAILQKDTHTYCFIANGDKADAIEVEILAQGIEGVVISGLQDGVKIVVSKPDILLKLLAGVGISTEED